MRYKNTLNKKIKKAKELELGTARIEQDEEDVRNIITYIDAWLPELWEKGHRITNFDTGETAIDDMKDDITDLKDTGEIARNEFVGKFTQDNTKLNYYNPIKRQPLKLFEKKTTKKKHLIPENEGQSFTDIFAMYVEPCAIVNKGEKNRNNNKDLFLNPLQNISSIPKTRKVPPANISTSIVDPMLAIRMISVAGLNRAHLSLGR